MSTGTCTVHSWNDGVEDDEGDPPLGLRVNDRLERDPSLYEPEPLTGTSTGRRATNGAD